MPTRDQEQLLEFSDTLLHALQVYFHVSRALTRVRLGLGADAPWHAESALVESFALHNRALAEFFYGLGSGRYGRHARAFHYFDSPEHWRRMVGRPGTWLKRVQFTPEKGSPEDRVDRFGAQIGHLTYGARPISDFARGWPVMQLANDIGRASTVFISAVDEQLVASDFKRKAWREIPVAARLSTRLTPLALWTRPALRPRPS